MKYIARIERTIRIRVNEKKKLFDIELSTPKITKPEINKNDRIRFPFVKSLNGEELTLRTLDIISPIAYPDSIIRIIGATMTRGLVISLIP